MKCDICNKECESLKEFKSNKEQIWVDLCEDCAKTYKFAEEIE